MAQWPPRIQPQPGSGPQGSLPSKAPRKEYHVAFDTRGTPGYLRAVKVTLELDMLPDDTAAPKALQERYDVSLCDHPLYPELRAYCLANPPGGRPRIK